MNQKIHYILILCLLLSYNIVSASIPQTAAAATAIIDDELQYQAYSNIKNSFFSLTLDNKPLKTPGPKGLPLQSSFLSHGSHPAWVHTTPNPIVKIYYNTPDSQSLIYEVELSETIQPNSDIQSFPFNIDLSQFPNSKFKRSKPLSILLQTSTTHPNEDQSALRYFLILSNKP